MHNTRFILNEQGEKLFVEEFIPAEAKATIIFCHGITGCRKGRTPDDDYLQIYAKELSELNYKVVLFDFSGHGDSEGQDIDVKPSKNSKELAAVYHDVVKNGDKVNFLAFSYGATCLCKFLEDNPEVEPNKIVLISPGFFPAQASFINENTAFGKDVAADYKSGKMKESGFSLISAKNFRLGYDCLKETLEFSPDYFKKFADRTLAFTGTQDAIFDTSYNINFMREAGIKNVMLDASHSLFEDFENFKKQATEFFES